MRLLFGNDELIAEWVARHLPNFRNAKDFGFYKSIGIAKDRELLAGAVYSNYRDFDVEFNIYAKSVKWCTKNTLKWLLYYPFVQLKCERMTATIADDDQRTQRLAKWIGFEIEGLIRKGYDGHKDAVIMGILKQDVNRWING